LSWVLGGVCWVVCPQVFFGGVWITDCHREAETAKAHRG